MSENNTENKLVKHLLETRDAESRRANLAEEKLLQIELSDLEKEKKSLKKQLAIKEEKVDQLERKVEALEHQLEYLKRQMWGSTSEMRRMLPEDPNQLKLDFDHEDMSEEEQELITTSLEEIKEYKSAVVREHVKRIPVRHKLPEGLPHIEEHIYPEGYLGHEEDWILFEDVETSEHLELKPAEFFVRITIRHKGILKDTNEIVTAPVQAEPIPKSYASASLLSDLIVGKYVDHLPFHRQIQRYKRLGMVIPLSTIEQWFHDVADLMRPSYFRLKELILSSGYVQSDETTVPIVDNEKHKTTKGYLWLLKDVISNQVCFHYYEGSRAAKVVVQLFDKYQGAIQTDGYSGYNILDKYGGIITLCCAAHCRRYFDRALSNDKSRAEYALEQIGYLYDVERMADSKNMSDDDRRKLRERLAYPILQAFQKWCIKEFPKVLPKSPIGKALQYFIQHSRQLGRYVLDGKYHIDNNSVENSVRPVACGRKNYLFCGNHEAAEDAAVIYSMMGCCKAQDVDFRTWLIHFLEHIHEYDTDYTKDLADLLPANFKKMTTTENKLRK